MTSGRNFRNKTFSSTGRIMQILYTLRGRSSEYMDVNNFFFLFSLKLNRGKIFAVISNRISDSNVIIEYVYTNIICKSFTSGF
jgi:hypothetical protein